MKKRIPQAIVTLYLAKTITQPPICPTRLISTKMVAKNLQRNYILLLAKGNQFYSIRRVFISTNILLNYLPQPHDISIYSLCSDHCVHIRIPSSKNVEIRHKRATDGKTCLPFLNI